MRVLRNSQTDDDTAVIDVDADEDAGPAAAREGKKRARGSGKGEVGGEEEGGQEEAEDLTQTQPSAASSNRREAMRKVAESRAAHFARADSHDRVRIRPVRSSTPFFGARKHAGEPPPPPFVACLLLADQSDQVQPASWNTHVCMCVCL
jgi:hypothetical protein